MAKNKIGLELAGFEELISDRDALNGDIKGAVSDSLKVAHETVTPKVQADMKRHKRTGRTADAIVTTSGVQWEGTTASIDVGFRFQKGLASVFLMYGTPRMKKDTKLYNDIYGSKTKKEIAAKQEKILLGAIQKRMGG